jgi:GNAT superfamily N-acetyltransferase
MLSWDRNPIKEIEGPGWVFSQVDDFTDFHSFDCNDEDLNDFVWNDAKRHKDLLIAETYAFKFVDDQGLATAPVAFASLSNDLIPLPSDLKDDYGLGGFLYKNFPAVKIGRLAVHKDLQDENIGTDILNILKVLFITNNRTGCRFITVNAINRPRTLNFYLKNDFQFLDEEKHRNKATQFMFYDLLRFKDSNGSQPSGCP